MSQTCTSTNLEEAALEDLAELVLNMATVIVERSGLLPAILPGASGNNTRSQMETYEALLRVFYVYMLYGES